MINGRNPPQAHALPLPPKKTDQRNSGQRLRALLNECSISPMAFSEFLHVSPQCMTNWFARGIPRHRTSEIARLLSVSETWLAAGTGPVFVEVQVTQYAR